jgi:Flp pilus assembly protein TadD
MFVALARQAGLQASFQEVDSPPDWSFRDDAFVLNRHVNVVVDLGRAGEQVVDFNVDDFKASYDRRVVSDERALAHYFNNVAVERLQAADTPAALAYLRKALAHDPDFSPAWTTLGTLYRRAGQAGHAEAAYLRALDADGSDTVAMSNLAALYERDGDLGRAAWYRRRVLAHRDRNPYYHFELGREAVRAGDYDAAIRHVKRAVRAKRNEDQFYFLLSLAYAKKGDTRTAGRYLVRAQRVAATDALRRRYESKMEALGQRPKPDATPH